MGRNGTNNDKKKIEGTDRYEERNCRRGRQAHQSLKAYWILQYLINNATEEMPVSINELIYELEDKGINTDRKSIYRDIKEINIINYMLENDDADVFDAEEAIENDVDGTEKLVIYDKTSKGYYVSQHRYDEFDIALIIESLYSNLSLSEGVADRLSGIVSQFMGRKKTKKLQLKLLSLDKRRSINKKGVNNLFILNSVLPELDDGISGESTEVALELSYQKVNENNELVTDIFKCNVFPCYIVLVKGHYELFCIGSDDDTFYRYPIDDITKVKVIEDQKKIIQPSIKKHLPDHFFNEEMKPYFNSKPFHISTDNNHVHVLVKKFGRKNLSYEYINPNKVVVEIKNVPFTPEEFFIWFINWSRIFKLEDEWTIEEFRSFLRRIDKKYWMKK